MSRGSPPTSRAWTRRGCIAVVLAAAAGCSGRVRLEAVSGEVVFNDGAPVAGGVVEFVPEGEGRAARGAIGPDGRFTLKTGPAAGARAGRYRVAVVHVFAGVEAASDHAHRRVHPRFARIGTSGLAAEVVPGRPNAPRFVVDAAEAEASRPAVTRP